MVCPLRYVLLALSLIVALIGLSQAAIEADEASSSTDPEKDAEKKKTRFQTLIDMLTGRYLMNAYYGVPALKAD
ncbi:unnamed protein product [Aphanomyces euteiches]|uniref:RxLR effector protein n=1 Tax=Aphanomyces euteiches TaxID=100861 RepID=A0A6G0WSN6_9STRA|nr:hypothetical protein Ae201684_011923 [Aphanomyces euteiches]KAH9056022.1 hypothetical protein Ae201684P_021762 [Aphanomyces euteiches]KAH9139066.1 hypothetical protein AeRB84_016662 [Aphanomyces euteiches]